MGWLKESTKRRTVWAIIIGLTIGIAVAIANSNDDDNGNAPTACIRNDGTHTDDAQFVAWLKARECR